MTLFQQESKYLMNTYATLPIEIAYGQGSYLFDKIIKNILNQLILFNIDELEFHQILTL